MEDAKRKINNRWGG